jgi:glucan-binding YG repeat protein
MNKNIKRIIAITLAISAYGVISAMTPGTYITSKTVYAASYSPSSEELKTLTVKSTNGDTLDLRDGYNGDDVKLSEDKDYYVKITDDSKGVKINATVKDSDYIIRIFTSDKIDAKEIKTGKEIELGKGTTTIYVRTYESVSSYRQAKDVTACKAEYRINVMKTKENDDEDNNQDAIYLSNLEVSNGKIDFLKQRTSYDLKVDSSVDTMRITAEPQETNNRVRIDGELVDSAEKHRKTVDLKPGKNEFKIKVTDNSDNQRTYTLNITRGKASDTQDDIYLNNLTISEGSIDYSDDETSYKVDLDDTVSKVIIGAEPENEGYLVKINGVQVKSADSYEKKISLKKGKNTVKAEIEDELNNKKRAYTITINRGDAEETDTDTNVNTDTNTKTDIQKDTDDKSTSKKTGWVETEAGWKYYNEKGDTVKNSWLLDKETGLYCYLNEDGLRKTGWFKDKDKWYMLNDKGAMLTGWYKAEAKVENNNISISSSNATTVNWYYLNTDGSMKTGWLLDSGKWYYFNSDGTMQRGWLIISNSKYYLNDDGTMTVGSKTITGKDYKFNNNGVLM